MSSRVCVCARLCACVCARARTLVVYRCTSFPVASLDNERLRSAPIGTLRLTKTFWSFFRRSEEQARARTGLRSPIAGTPQFENNNNHKKSCKHLQLVTHVSGPTSAHVPLKKWRTTVIFIPLEVGRFISLLLLQLHWNRLDPPPLPPLPQPLHFFFNQRTKSLNSRIWQGRRPVRLPPLRCLRPPPSLVLTSD